MENTLKLSLKANDMICAAGEEDHDLYILESGRLLVFVNEKTKITPVSTIEAGNYFGEFSFFDKKPRSAHVVCTEDSTLIKIPLSEVEKKIPGWIITLSQYLTGKARRANELIAKKGIRKKKVKTVPALSIEEQRKYYKILEEYKKNNNLS